MSPPKPLFVRGPSLTVRLVVLLLASVALMVADHRFGDGGWLQGLRGALSVAVLPLQLAVNAPFDVAHWAGEHLATRDTLLEENDHLRRERLLLDARLGRLVDLEAENRRLREMLDSSSRIGERVVVAEVMAVELDPSSHKLLLNRGTRDGVAKGQPLIDASGVMGQVVHAGPLSCTALLITDPNHALPVQLPRNGLRSIAIGRGISNSLELAHVPNNADIQVGDVVVTSGLGGRFPSGYPVGRVTQVRFNTGRPFAEVTVEPAARLERNREVLLVWAAGEGAGDVARNGRDDGGGS
jgi:rod shape-determining protein MreC